MTNTIIFDMDGVLFDTERMACECWKEVAGTMGLSKVDEGVAGCIGLNQNDARAYMLDLYGEEFPFDSFHDTTHALLGKRIEEEGIPLKEGVMELLDYLTENQYIIGLASSNSKKIIVRNLEMAGISHYFHTIAAGDMVEHSKPQPDIYLMACEELGVSPGNAIAIEDSPNGIRSAYRAGMKPVMIPDMVVPASDIEAMLYGKFYSLLDVVDYLKSRNGEN